MKSHSGLSRFVAFCIAIVGAACISLLAGCGQKGPLYMPGYPAKPIKSTGMPHATSVPDTPAPTPAPTDSK